MTVTETDPRVVNPASPEALIRERVTDAVNYRKQFEHIWVSSLRFVAGNQWDVYDTVSRSLISIQEAYPHYEGRELYQSDIIHEYRGAALGELGADSDRPELLLPGNGDTDPVDEDIQAQVNRAVGHDWDYELRAGEALEDAQHKCVDLGVSAVRIRWDRDGGKARTVATGDGEQPVEAPVGADGTVITDAEKARSYVADTQAQGGTAKFQALYTGKHCMDVGSAFNILAPPGVPHEKNFPWEVWVEAIDLDTLRTQYAAAAELTADPDVQSVLGLGVKQAGAGPASGAVDLRNHVWVYTYYERASRKFPKGRVAVMAGRQKVLLEPVTERLPYECVDGTWESGIVYFHWNRLTDRFYSRSLTDALKDPQRLINRRQTQSNEIIDRGMPFMHVEEGTYVEDPSGTPMEIRELKKGTGVEPKMNPGIGPGPWMYQDKEALREDATHAATLSALRLGENPPNVNTYSQLATLNEQEAQKRSAIRSQHQRARCRLVEFAVYDIQRYWPAEKQILVGGPENKLQAELFAKSKIPAMFVVGPAQGASKPRGQAAQLQLVTDIWNAALASGAVLQDPGGWVEWYKRSLDAGEPLDLPSVPSDGQMEKAQIENHLLMMGEQPAVAYWDNAQKHIPLHRQSEDQAILAGDLEAVKRHETHIEEHMSVQLENQQQIAQQAAPTVPGAGVPLPAGPGGPQVAAPPAEVAPPAPPQAGPSGPPAA